MEKSAELLNLIAEKVISADNISDIEIETIGTLRWTGWKEVIWALEKHAQIVLFRRGNDEDHYYVDIPSMQHGKFKAGNSFCIEYKEGISKQMYPMETTVEDLREWFKEAVMILIEDVLIDHPEILTALFAKKEEVV